MSTEKPVVYDLFDSECMAFVDYAKKRIVVDERGGWSRRYEMGFATLATYATEWGMTFDPAAPEAQCVELGARLILAKEALAHGLSADQYLQRPTMLSDDNKKTVQAFERLVALYGVDLVVRSMGADVRAKLKKTLG